MYNEMNNVEINSLEYKNQFMHEATRLAIESVEKGWGGPFGAVIVTDRPS
jgi:tRNA(Arg) A34 adenosine deaminase TadA